MKKLLLMLAIGLSMSMGLAGCNGGSKEGVDGEKKGPKGNGKTVVDDVERNRRNGSLPSGFR